MRILITLDGLEAMGGEYTGTIKDVVLEKVNNKLKGRHEEVPHISFMESGHVFIPNEENKEELRAVYGHETDLWIGKRLGVYVEEIERANGEGSGAYKKVVKCLDPPLRK